MAVNRRGEVLEVGEVRTISTDSGDRDVVTVRIRTDDGPVAISLRKKWTKTAEILEPGMELSVTALTEADDGFETTEDSAVVVEPDFLVDVTDIRSWVQCPRLYYLNKIGGLPLEYPVTKGTIVHEVFGDLLRGQALDAAVEKQVEKAGLELGLLGRDRNAVIDEVRQNAAAIDAWLSQGRLDEDGWRSEVTLLSDTYGIKGRCDAIRRGNPVELKTGKNTSRSPRFQDKIQAASYALLLEEQGVSVDTGTLLYTKNAALEEETGDLSPAKDFSIGDGLTKFVLRTRNEIAAMEHDRSVPTGYEGDATCQYCFEQDTCLVVSGRLDQPSKAGSVGDPLPEAERTYFQGQYDAIETERRAIHQEYAKLWKQSAQARADADRALIGLEPAGRTQLPDGRWELRAERPAGAVSKIREGDRVLASDGDPIDGHTELAVVESLGREIVLRADEPLSVRRLDVYPSEFSVDRMLTALHDALLRGPTRRRDLLFERDTPTFSGPTRELIDNNPAQNRAINTALRAEDFALIHGPPGTGKTYTIARLIRALVDRGDRVLLSAFTNRAVDNALSALVDQGFEDAIRMGTESGVRSDMAHLRLDTAGDPNERAEALESAPVVAATTASCGSRVMRSQSFDVVVVDEASQLTEPDTLAAINRGAKFVLVGDHKQLPPVVQSGADLSTSLFQRLIETYPEAAVMLDRQYRMSQRIQAFASREFYDGQLRPATGSVASQTITDLGLDPTRTDVYDGVTLVPVEGTNADHTDTAEAERVAEIATAYLAAGAEPDDLGVIAPFRAQVSTIEPLVPDGVTVDTVDRFQGSSTEILLVSFVASGSLDGPLFEDERRMNVALTRAKKALVLVGDPAALESRDQYARMVDWADRAAE
ncbi:DNA helicase [Halodesulfurarchaeum formicicum]|uniref:DNA helicase n=1 Tax=Halodesulfurarchaeum formicicum TaxID=1873524 RepID=A0A1J1AAK3_9EURY|nr:DNA helicase [Halodesulfurarchaeum formicicum]